MNNTNEILHHGYYTIGENKGKPRIWLQGGNLEAVGFNKGVDYEVIYDFELRTITYLVTKESSKDTRVVSSKTNKKGKVSPIIDLSSLTIADIAGDAEKVRADFKYGSVVISLHHMDIKRQEREKSLADNLNSGEVTKAVLCCGIGISTAAAHDGLAANGIKSRTTFIVDRERKYLDVAMENNHALDPFTRVIEASLEEVEPSIIPRVNLLQVSLPCTGQGASGKAKNKIKFAEEHPVDAMAILGLIRFIDACQPAVIISENVVPAMTSATYILLKGMLGSCGYNVNEVVLDSEQTKSMENRRRYWFVATSKGLNQVNLSQFPSFEKEYATLGEMLENIPSDSPMWKSTEEKVRKAALNKENGKNFGFNLVDHDAEFVGVCGKGYQKDRASEPHIKGDNNTMRLLTVSELAKAQSTPLHLVNNAIDGVAYEGLGQAIDYRQGTGIFDMIAKQVLLPLFTANSVNTELLAA